MWKSGNSLIPTNHMELEMGLHEEEEREFDESVLLCLRLRERVFLLSVFGFREKEIFGF